jgi:hypothetical protein
MRFPFALACGVLAASCAAPPESSAPMPAESAPPESAPPESAPAESALAPAVSEPERGLLDSRLGDAPLDFTPNEPIGEAQEPIAWALVIMATCMVAGALAAEYGCKKNVLHDLCPPGTALTKTIHDTMDKKRTVTVRIPCDVLETMICGTGAVTAGEIMKHMCAGTL